MRSRPIASGKNPTEAQLIQRARFTLISQFLSPITDLLRVGFQAYNEERSGYNAAFKLNIENGITGSYPAWAIDYAKSL